MFRKIQTIDAFCSSYDYHNTLDIAEEQDAFNINRNILYNTYKLLQEYRKELRRDAYQQSYSQPQSEKDEDARFVRPSRGATEPDSRMCSCQRHVRICIST